MLDELDTKTRVVQMLVERQPRNADWMSHPMEMEIPQHVSR